MSIRTGPGARRAPSRRPPASDRGTSLAEVLIALGLMAVVSAISVPTLTAAVDQGNARQAAGFVAAKLRQARLQAIGGMSAVALVFDEIGGDWQVRLCVDGNRNGIRRADIDRGRDRCPEGPHSLRLMFPVVQVRVDGSIPGPDDTESTSDPVRFGASDIASFSPAGTGTSGTLYLTSARGTQFAVRVAGATGRTRVLQYDATLRQWLER